MKLFYFILKTGKQIIPDYEGVELPDEAAARLHAAMVAQQLMRNREVNTRAWRIQVADDYLTPLFDLFFVDVDARNQRFPLHVTAPMHRVIRTIAAFNDTLMTTQDTLKDARDTLAHADRVLATIRHSASR